MKKKYSTVILVSVLLVGLGLFLYPSISHYWNTVVASHAVDNYNNTIASLSKEDYSELFRTAEDYNSRLLSLEAPLNQFEEIEGYQDTLRAGDSPLLGVISIDKIKVELPIYHSTTSSSLSDGVGHMEGTELPTGGIGNHTVLSAHRGLPSSRLFTDLDKVEEGDIFTVTVLDRTLTYQVDRITIALPEETQYLLPVAGEDLCTLVTCTPYGVNTHRLLVRGKRIDNIVDNAPHIVNEAMAVDNTVVAIIIGIPILLILILITAIFDILGRRKGY